MRFICPLITVTDMAVSRRFYETVLQMRVQHDFGENIQFEDGLSLHEKGHFAGLIGAKPEDITSRARNMELYFEEEDIEAFAASLEAYGVALVHPLARQPWGQRVVRFYDPDGHIIEVGEPIPGL